jgi:hypothetical protein
VLRCRVSLPRHQVVVRVFQQTIDNQKNIRDLMGLISRTNHESNSMPNRLTVHFPRASVSCSLLRRRFDSAIVSSYASSQRTIP